MPSCQILKFIERPEVGSVTMPPGWPQHITVSRLRPWGSPRVGKASRAHIPRPRRGWGASECLGPAPRLTRGHVLLSLMISSNSWVPESSVLGRPCLRFHMVLAYWQAALGSFLGWCKGMTEGWLSKRVTSPSPEVTGNVGYFP